MVDSVPPENGCEVLDEELTHEYWGENDNNNTAGSDDSHILLKWGVIIIAMRGEKFQKLQYDPLQLSTRE